jgi:hypothetical protein
MSTLSAAVCSAVLLGGLHCAASAQPTPFEAQCRERLRPTFTINTIQAGYQIENNTSTRVLHKRSMHSHSSDLMLGLTAVTSRVEVGVSGHVLQEAGTGRECLAPQIDIELRYQPLKVYIAREFSPLGCPYREVLEHEMRHVQLYLDHLPKVEALVRAELERRYAGKPLYSGSGDTLSALEQQIDAWLWPMIKTEMHRVELYQRTLDTDEEESRLSRVCSGELAYNLRARY